MGRKKHMPSPFQIEDMQRLEQMRREYEYNRPINVFIRETLVVSTDPLSYITKEDFRRRFQERYPDDASANEPTNNNKIKQRLIAFGAREKMNHGKERKNVWMGIAWKPKTEMP